MADKETPPARGGEGRETASALPHRRLSMFAGVSTPTYLCKSFNLTPPYRAYPERDRISKPIRIHCLDGGERRSTRSSHTIAFPLSRPPPSGVYIGVKSCATRALRFSLQPGNTRKLMYLRFNRARARAVYDAVGEERRSAFYCDVLARLSEGDGKVSGLLRFVAFDTTVVWTFGGFFKRRSDYSRNKTVCLSTRSS